MTSLHEVTGNNTLYVSYCAFLTIFDIVLTRQNQIEMKRIIFGLIVLYFPTKTLSGQTYDEYIFQANELYQSKKFGESSKVWDKAFNIHKGYASDYYNSACTKALAGESEKSFDHLRKAIRSGWNDIEWMKKDSDFASIKSTADWQALINQIPELQREYLASLNVEMKNRLEKLRMQDQTIRLLLPDAEKRFGVESEAYQWFRNELMPENDSVVLVDIIKIIDQHGWLGINEVGVLANQTLWLIIQHAPLETQEKYLSYLEKSVAIGESKARYFAFLQDRILMRKSKKQIYGTQSLWNKEKKKNVIWAIADVQNVNKLRKKVGLETIEAYAANSGFLFEPDTEE